MINIENETRGAAPRHFGPLGFAFLVLALSFGSFAANAAPQVLKGNAGRTACRITNINAATGVVTAKVLFEEGGIAGSKTSGSGQSFRFLVKESALLRSLKDGQEIFADFNTQQVFTSAGVRLGSILTDISGKSPAGPAGGTNAAQKVQGAQPAGPGSGSNPPPKVQGTQPTGPGSGSNPQANKILGSNKAAEPVVASGGGVNPPNKILQPNKTAEPVGPTGGANLGNAVNPATSAGKNPSIPPTAGSNLGGAAAPAASVSQITNINTPRGIVSAKVNSNGQAFRFFVRDPALLSSLEEGQQIVADFNTQEAFTSAGASGRGVRLGSILTDTYEKSSGGAAGGTNLPQKIAGTNPAGPGATGGQPKTESAPVAPAGSAAGRNQAATNAPSSSTPATLATAVRTAVLQANPVCSSDPSHLTQGVASGVIVSSGATIYCRFTVPSDVAQQAGTSVTVSLSDSSVASGPTTAALSTASGGSGSPYADFQISTQPISETFPLTISTSCGQFSGSTKVTLARAAIKSFMTYANGATPFGGYLESWSPSAYPALALLLTAPADPDGFHVPVTANDGSFTGELDVTGGQEGGAVWYVPHQPVLTDTPVTYSVHDPLDGSLQTVKIVVTPPYVQSIRAVSLSVNNIPLDGTQVPVSIGIFGDAPAGGMTFNVNYSAVDAKNNALPSEITGPSTVTLPAGTVYNYSTQLTVTVFPCGVNPPCKATVSAGGQTLTITVNP